MSLHLKAGRLTIDQGGRSVFDTEDKLFHNITTGINGSKSFSARSVSGGSNWVNVNTNHEIASCNPFCTHVVGSIRFRIYSMLAPTDVWFAYEGGDVFAILDHTTGIKDAPYTTAITGFTKYRFFISGSKVYLNERVIMHSNASKTFAAHVLDWKLKAGRFT